MPYISATIIIQLLTAVVPTLSKLAREEGGRTKIIQYGRYLTVLLCLGQGLFMALGWENPEKIFGAGHRPIGALFTGAYLVLPAADHACPDHRHDAVDVAGRADHRARHRQRRVPGHHHWHPGPPAAGRCRHQRHVLPRRWRRGEQATSAMPSLLVGLLAGVIAAVIAITQAQRKVPVQYAQRAVGRKVYAGGTSFMPLRVNYLGRHAHHLRPGDPDVPAERSSSSLGSFSSVRAPARESSSCLKSASDSPASWANAPCST